MLDKFSHPWSTSVLGVAHRSTETEPFGLICWTLGHSGPIVGPWAVRAQLLDPGPFGPICWAHLLDPGPFGPICWTLGRSGPFVGPCAVRAHLLGPGPFGPIGWACPCSGGHDPYAGFRGHHPYAGFRGHDPLSGVHIPLESRVHNPKLVFGALGPIWGGSCGLWRPKAD